jgi:transcription initiation factor IIE alpha subunit
MGLLNGLTKLAIGVSCIRAVRRERQLDREIAELDQKNNAIVAETREMEEEYEAAMEHGGQHPVGKCPDCGEYWFGYDPFCGNCGRKRNDF